MIHLHLVFVGKTAFPEMDQAIQRYLDRLRHYASVEVHLVRAEKIAERSREKTVMDREGERILKLVGSRDVLVALDRHGAQLDSEGLAAYLEQLKRDGSPEVWMAIGGPVGHSKKILERANRTLALSRMTFPHDLTRLILVEQLYRAFTILKGEPYHR
ncbi:MAG: 23S rRNA (pseudouridine(1915)-N(3))-methyltransferase RlmH [Syntrophobacteraceae bacterium]|jgi:23S rRNA (pseudouridine1915-N3)-methyltransferase|nr:23S rRNA (pseudouridine(1915)-N(3))-methyltransferase RlmH [Syntrophobacteraceae bacterium]